jgi:hypothetical protein
MARAQHLRNRRIVLAASAVLWLALACALGSETGRPPADLPPQAWWKERGPVVPHDSFPADCALCHEGGTWTTIRADFSFDHEAATGTPLVGAHARAECLRCHNDRGPVELFARRGCAGCHEDVHRGRLGRDCSVCHEEEDWRVREAIANHQRTRFPLVGAHAATACWDCHPGAEVGNFDRAPVDCVTCHREDLARATSPDHVANDFVDRCDRCHIPTTWTGAGFNHGFFPLTGAHAALACDACHPGGMFQGTPNQCVGCHLDDYQGAMDPDHQGAGFPTSCELCHDTTSWENAFFAHAFPLQGPHDQACAECHQSPGNYGLYSCTHCHEHSQSQMDADHDEVPGYVWQSSACYSCHPDGQH